MRVDNPRSSGSWPAREGIEIDGVTYTGRTLRHRFGTQNRDTILTAYPQAKVVQQVAKGRYFAFRGPRSVQKRDRAAIRDLVQLYPKRPKEKAAP